MYSRPHGKPELISVKALLRMKATSDGGRMTGFISGYRPDHVFEYIPGEVLRAFMGDIQFDGQEFIQPGEERIVTVRFISFEGLRVILQPGRIWWIHEGPNQLGEATVLEVLI